MNSYSQFLINKCARVHTTNCQPVHGATRGPVVHLPRVVHFRSTSFALPAPLDQQWTGSGSKRYHFGPVLDHSYFGSLRSTAVHFSATPRTTRIDHGTFPVQERTESSRPSPPVAQRETRFATDCSVIDQTVTELRVTDTQTTTLL